MAKKQFLDQHGYEMILVGLGNVQTMLKKEFEHMAGSTAQTAEDLVSANNPVDTYRRNVANTLHTINRLTNTMRKYLQIYLERQNVNPTGCAMLYGIFGSIWSEASSAATDYSQSISYQFGVENHNSFRKYEYFSQEFSHMKDYLELEKKTGYRHINHYMMMADALSGNHLGVVDREVKRVMESGMKSILNGMPTTELPSKIEAIKAIGKKLGIPDFEERYKMFKVFLKEWAENQQSVEDLKFESLKETDEYKKLMKDLSPLKREEMEAFFENQYTHALTKIGNGIDTAEDWVDYIEKASDLIIRCYANYDEQVSYLDSMQSALLAAGYDNDLLQDEIDDLRNQYTSKAYYAANMLVDEVISSTRKGIEKTIVGSLPGLAEADFVFDALSATTEMHMKDEISAIDSLNGLQFYEHSLTRAYDRYLSLMENDLATATDVQNADKIYDILLRTKREEYAKMIELSREHNIGDLNRLKKEYEELNQMSYSTGHMHSISDKEAYDELNCS